MVWLLSRGLRRAGHDVSVVATVEDGAMRAKFEALGAATHVLHKPSGVHLPTFGHMLRVLRRAKPTLVHTHHLGAYVYAAPAAAWLGVPHVHTEHSHEFYDTVRRRWLGRCMSSTSQVVSVSHEVAAHRAEVLGKPCVVVPNGVEGAPVALPERRHRRSLTLGVLGRLAAEKNVELAVRALSLLPEAELLIVGDGPERKALQTLTKRLGLQRRVHFAGWQRDARRWLRQMDLLLVPSKREGLPLAVLEALHEGVPFVGTPVGDLPALAALGAGLVTAPTPTCMATTIRRLLRQRPSSTSLQALAMERFHVDVMVDAYQRIYAEAA